MVTTVTELSGPGFPYMAEAERSLGEHSTPRSIGTVCPSHTHQTIASMSSNHLADDSSIYKSSSPSPPMAEQEIRDSPAVPRFGDSATIDWWGSVG